MTQRSAEDWQRYAQETAVALELAIGAEDWPAVMGVFGNLARAAHALMQFPLPDEIESAPVFTAAGERAQ